MRGGWGPPEREGPQGRPMPPPYLLEQDRIDEIPAESGAVFYAAGPLISRLQEKLNFLFKEEFGNKFVEFKGEWIETKHTGYVQLPGGGWKHQSTVSYCYVLTRELLDGYLLDNRTWRSMMPNVVPKRVPSLLDVIKEPQKYKDNSYARCIVEALSYKKAYFIKRGAQKTQSFSSGMNGLGLNSRVLKNCLGCSLAVQMPEMRANLQ
jgi:hypothetical protein